MIRSVGSGRSVAVLLRRLVHWLIHVSRRHWATALGWVPSGQALGIQGAECPPAPPRRRPRPTQRQDRDPRLSGGPDTKQNWPQVIGTRRHRWRPRLPGKDHPWPHRNPEDLLFRFWGLTGKYQDLPIETPKPRPLSFQGAQALLGLWESCMRPHWSRSKTGCSQCL